MKSSQCALRSMLPALTRALNQLSQPEVQRHHVTTESEDFAEPNSAHPAASAQIVRKDGQARAVLGDSFEFLFTINPIFENGVVKPLWPYLDSRYANRTRHRYGNGPFCSFRSTAMPYKSGVYLLCIGEEVMYVGIGNTLRQRFESYGHIHAHNCFKGNRPQTTARVNQLIYEAFAAGMSVDVWVKITGTYRTLEEQIIHGLGHPSWNRLCPRCGWRRSLSD